MRKPRLIQGVLRLSAHVLDEDKTQLVEQLLGRLGYFDWPEIQGILEVGKHGKYLISASSDKLLRS